MARKVAGIDMSGPFFTADPAKTFRRNIRDFMDEVVALGEADVEARLRSGEGSRASISGGNGRVSAYVVGRTRSLRGKRWAVTGVVSVNPQGKARRHAIAIMAAASEVEAQTGAFKKVTASLRRAKTNLLKGLT